MRRQILVLFLFWVWGVTFVYGQEDLKVLPGEGTGYTILDLTQSDFTLRGHATATGASCFLITKDSQEQKGQIWWPNKLNVAQNFRLDFVIFAGVNLDGADGFAFVMQRDPNNLEATGDTGQALGLGGIRKSLGIEIDTYQNTDFYTNCSNATTDLPNVSGDPVDDHLALIGYNGLTTCPIPVLTTKKSGTLDSLVREVTVGNLKDADRCPRFSIVWDYISAESQRIRVFLDGELKLMQIDNFFSERFLDIGPGDTPEVTWGYTGATGDEHNEQTVCVVTNLGAPVPVDDNTQALAGVISTMNVLSNDEAASPHSELWIGSIVDLPTKGDIDIDSEQKRIRYRANNDATGTDQFTYQVCDNPNAQRCYTTCEVATVNVTIGCAGERELVLNPTDNTNCQGDGGYVDAAVLGIPFESYTYAESFLGYEADTTSGEQFFSNGREIKWEGSGSRTVIEHSKRGIYTSHPNGGGGYYNVPPERTETIKITIPLPSSDPNAIMRISYKIGAGAGEVENGEIRQSSVAGSVRFRLSDTNGDVSRLSPDENGSSSYSIPSNTPGALRTFTYTLDASDFGALDGAEPYTMELRISNTLSYGRGARFDDFEVVVTPYNDRPNYNSDYAFTWYKDAVDPNNVIADATSSRLSGQPNGSYIAVAALTPDGNCSLTPDAAVTVDLNAGGVGDITVVATSLTNCETSNGRLSATVTSGDEQVTEGYSFEWFEKGDLDITVASTAEATGLGAATYTVVVTDDESGCTKTHEADVTSALIQPSINLDKKTDAASCVLSPFGSATVSSDGDNADYVFEWFKGNFEPPNVIPDNADLEGAEQTALEQAPYAIRAVHVATKCASDPLLIEIENQAGEVQLNVVENRSPTNCSDPHNGRLVVEASYNGGAIGATGYTFDFFAAPNVLEANKITETSENGHTGPFIEVSNIITRLEAREYTVRATHTNSSCNTDSTFTVAAGTQVLPIITEAQLVTQSNSSCATDVATGQIEMQAAVTTGGVQSTEGYTYKISSLGSLPDPHFLENTTGLFADLRHGDYTLQVTDQGTRCVSEELGIRIEQAERITGVSLTNQEPNTACNQASANGAVTVEVALVSGATVAQFRYDLFLGDTDVGTPAQSAETASNTHTFSDLATLSPQNGTYRVVAWDVAASCSEWLTITIQSTPFLPTYATNEADITHDTSCQGNNGSVTVNLVDNLNNPITDPATNGYRFEWSDASSSVIPRVLLVPVANATNSLSNQAAIGLRLEVEGANGCRSDEKYFTIEDKEQTVGVSIEAIATITACRQADADGSFRANIAGGNEADYAFEWFSQELSVTTPLDAGTPGSGIATNRVLTDQWEGAYLVHALHNGSNCTGTAEIRLSSTREAPIVSLSSTVPNTNCTGTANGSATVQVTYDGSTVTDYTDLDFTLNLSTITPSVTLGDLEAREHNLQVSRLGCTGSLTFVVSQSLVPPDLNRLNNITVTPSQSCDESLRVNGTVSVRPDGAVDGTGYTFTWYNEAYSATAIPVTGETSFRRETLRSGTYSALVTNDATGCTATNNVDVGLVPNTVPTVSFGLQEVTDCDPNNGSIRANLSGGDVNDYDWYWFEGADETAPSLQAQGGVVLPPGSAQGLGPGAYALRYVEKATACQSTVYTRSIGLAATVAPVATVTTTAAGDCRALLGAAVVDITGPTGRSFDINIYQGAPTDFSGLTAHVSATDVAVGTHTLDVAANVYTLRVTERTSQCDLRQPMVVSFVAAPTVVGVSNVEPSNCASYTDAAGNGGQGGASGAVTITVGVRVTALGLNHDSYQLFLYAAPDLLSSATFFPQPDLTQGSQQWTTSEGRPRIIQRIAAAQGGAATGRAAPDPQTGSLGRGVNINLGIANREYVFAGLAGNTDASINNYMVVAVEEGWPRCFSEPAYFNVPRGNDELTIAGENVVDNASCGPQSTATGSIGITNITRGTDVHNTVAQLRTNYSFEWFEGGSINAPTLGTNFGLSDAQSATGLPSGQYTVRITKTTITDGDDNGCSTVAQRTINNDRPALVLSNVDIGPLTHCATPNGSINVDEVTIGTSAETFSTVLADYEVTLRTSNNVSLSSLTPSSTVVANLAADTYTLRLRNTQTSCIGTLLQQTILDERRIPNVDVAGSTISPNTNCTGTFNGGVVLVFDGVTPDVHNWYEDAVGGTSIVGDATVTDLEAGTYAVAVVVTASSCNSSAVFSVPDDRINPSLAFDPSNVAHRTTCGAVAANGSVGLSAGNLSPTANYEIVLYSNNAPPLTQVATESFDLTAVPPPSTVQLSALDPGAYFMRAEDQTTGCTSSFSRFEVKDEGVLPQLDGVTVIDDRGCGTAGLSQGAVDIVLRITDPNYLYDITVGSATETGVASANVPRLGGFSSGPVSIQVQNTVNGCSYTNTIEIGKQVPLFSIDQLTTTDQTYCNGDGSIQVLAISFDNVRLPQSPGQPSVYSDYTFAWTDENSNVIPNGTHEYEQVNLLSGRYNVQVTHTATTCQLEASYEVNQRLTFPLLVITQVQPDQSCLPASANGILVGTADGQDHQHDGDGDGSPDYIFTWYEGDVNGNNRGATARVANLVGGKHTLEVRNQITRCVSQREVILIADPVQPTIAKNTAITYTAVTQCVSPFDGVVRLTAVQPGDLIDYDISWYDVDPTAIPTPAPAQTVTNGNATFTDLDAQTYYIQLRHQVFGCESLPYEVAPPDNTVKPVVVLEGLVSQTHCDLARPNGEMLVSADGSQDATLYRFEWSRDGNPPLVVNQSGATDLAAGSYQILATNNNTGCQGAGTFLLQDLIINPLTITVQTRPNRRCEAPYAGILIADVDNKLPQKQTSDYGFYWTTGTAVPTISNSEHPQGTWANLDGGVYTVVAYDRDDPTCASFPTPVEVEDVTVIPVIRIRKNAFLTNCDPNRPNAVLEALIPVDPDYNINYNFTWYDGSAPTGQPTSTSALHDHLDVGTYTVEAQSLTTACQNVATTTVSTAYQYPDPPILILERARTGCTAPNGVASVTLPGDPLLYGVEWFAERDLSNVLSDEIRIETLDTLNYYVYVMNKDNLCRSQFPAKVSVPDAIEEKRFDVATVPSLCTQPTGGAVVVIIDPMKIQGRIWTRVADNQVFTDAELAGMPAGEYAVEVTSKADCKQVKRFTIADNLRPYTGVSVNGDGVNDVLTIDCIERYADNSVEIYDRDGNLVFRQSAYNNREKVFAGNSNTGFYVGQTKLPEGTYYYAIDRGDNTPISVGFFELIR